MKTVLQDIGIFALGVLIGVVLGNTLQWRGCGRVTGNDTTTTMVPVTPPAVQVTPNPAPAVLESNRELVLRVDSLLRAQERLRATGLAREDSLRVVMAFRDSLLLLRSLPVKSVQRIDALTPEGLNITGSLYVTYTPLSRMVTTNIKLDSVKVPVRTVIVTKEVTVFPMEYVIGAVVVGGVVGAYLYSRAK